TRVRSPQPRGAPGGTSASVAAARRTVTSRPSMRVNHHRSTSPRATGHTSRAGTGCLLARRRALSRLRACFIRGAREQLHRIPMTPYDLTRSRDLIVLDGTTFFFSDPTGDAGTADAHGYFY